MNQNNEGARIVAFFQPQYATRHDCKDMIDRGVEVDVTSAVLSLPLTEIHALEDDTDSTNDLVCAKDLGHDGPHRIEVVAAVCDFFQVESLTDITAEQLKAAGGVGIAEPSGNVPNAIVEVQATGPAYRVTLYAVVRVTVDVATASSQLDAIAKAESATDLHEAFRGGEYAEEIVGVLVDEDGDSEYLKSTSYLPSQEAETGWAPAVSENAPATPAKGIDTVALGGKSTN